MMFPWQPVNPLAQSIIQCITAYPRAILPHKKMFTMKAVMTEDNVRQRPEGGFLVHYKILSPCVQRWMNILVRSPHAVLGKFASRQVFLNKSLTSVVTHAQCQ